MTPIRTEELIICTGAAVIGAIPVVLQVASGGIWGAEATIGLAMLILGVLGLVVLGFRPRRSRP